MPPVHGFIAMGYSPANIMAKTASKDEVVSYFVVIPVQVGSILW